LLDAYGVDEPEARTRWKALLEETFHFKPRRADRFLEEGQVIDLEGVAVAIIHTPGHTPGHLGFHFVEPDVLFLGDYDLTAFGPWYGDRDSSIAHSVASVQRLRSIPARVWLTAHETGVFDAAPPELWDAYLGVIDRRRQALLEFLATPRRMDEIVDAWIAYRKPREPLDFYTHAEKALMGKHLEALMAERRVACDGCRYRRV
jgi:glyoxylase-like metal-dependent hydrolase (beta-lactamase superfamily II)